MIKAEIQAPMADVQNSALTIAISNAARQRTETGAYVDVLDCVDMISLGRHERFVIDKVKFVAKLALKGDTSQF